MRAVIVLTIVVALCGLTTTSPLRDLLERLLEKADHKRALYGIRVTDTTISGYPADWGQCPTFDCIYNISCDAKNADMVSQLATLTHKVEFDNLKPGLEYTCGICIQGTTKCSLTAWTCTTKEKGANYLDLPCRSKIQNPAKPRETPRRNNNIDKIEDLLEQLRS